MFFATIIRLLLLVKFTLSIEKICVSSDKTSCDGNCPINNIQNNFFSALSYIESQYYEENADFEILFCDEINILNQELLINNAAASLFSTNLNAYSFFVSFSNLNLTLKSKDDQFKSKVYFRTNNFSIFISKGLLISNLDIYGNDMVFQEINHDECNRSFNLCCENSDIMNPNSQNCGFANLSNNSTLGNAQNNSLAPFLIEGSSEIGVKLINVTLNGFIVFKGNQIKYNSFIFLLQSGYLSLSIENFACDTSFFEFSFINQGNVTNIFYDFKNVSIRNYSFFLQNTFFVDQYYFLSIKSKAFASFNDLKIENSQKFLFLNNAENVSLMNCTIIFFDMFSKKDFNLFYLNNSFVNLSFIQISEINKLYNLTENSSLIFMDQNNKIALNFVLIKNCNFPNNFPLIYIGEHNNNITSYETYFYNISGNGKVILVKNGDNTLNLFRVLYSHSSLIFLSLDNLISDNKIQILESTFNMSFEKIFIVSGTLNMLTINKSSFFDNSALSGNGVLGIFQNNNKISFVECKILLKQQTNSVLNSLYIVNIASFKIESCLISSGPLHFIKGIGISNFISKNNTILKSAGFKFYEFYLSNIEIMFVIGTSVVGSLEQGNTYYSIFSLNAVSNLLIKNCSFSDLNILLDKFGSFYITNYFFVQNCNFKNMLSWTFDSGYLIQSTYYNANTYIVNCSFQNLSSNNQSQLFFFQYNSFVKISKCFFNSAYSTNVLDIDPTININGAGVLFSMFNNYVIVTDNKFSNCIADNSFWGLFSFVASSAEIKNNVFILDNILVGSIFSLTFMNSILFVENIISVENLSSIYKNLNYSLFFLSMQNNLHIRNLTFDFKNLITPQDGQSLSGFILDANSNNNVLIENLEFRSKAQNKQWIKSLFSLIGNNNLYLLNCTFNHELVSPFLFSSSNNKIVLNHTILQKFYECIISSNMNDEIIIQNTEIFYCISDSMPFFKLYFSANLIFTNSIIKYCHSFSSSIIFAYDSNKILLNNTSFVELTTNADGGMMFLTLNNLLFCNFLDVYNISSFTAGFSYLQNNNTVFTLMSTFNEITSLSSAGCFYVLANNSLNIFFSKFNNISSITFAGFLISFSQNIIFLKNTLISNSKAHHNSAGLIYLIFNNSLQILDSYAENISAANEAGGYLKADNINVILIHNCNLANSMALKGGFIFLESSNIILISSILYINSSANLYGGCINLNYKNQVKILNSSFNLNEAFLDGGFFYGTSENIIYFQNISIILASSLNSMGGTIYLDFNNILFMKNIYINNTFSKAQGSFLYMRSNNTIKSETMSIENSGIINFANYYDTSMISSPLKNFLVINYTNIFGNVSCYNVFQLNQSRIKSANLKISPENYSINSIYYLEQCYFIGRRLQISQDYGYLMNVKFSSINIEYFKKNSPNVRFLNQIYFVFISSNVTIKGFSSKFQNKTKENMNIIQIMYTFQSDIKLKGFNVGETNNYHSIKLIEIYNSNFTLKESVFVFNRQRSSENSANIDISFSGNSSENFLCKIEKVIFAGNQAFKKSSSLNFFSESENFKTKILISNSLFVLNEGNLGGSIYISNVSHSKILRNRFKKNEAMIQIKENKAKGGALFSIIQSPSFELLIQNNNFQENVALIGGALYINDPFNKMKNQQNSFLSNQAQFYGHDIASSINVLTFLQSDATISFLDEIPQRAIVITGHNYTTSLIKIGGFDKFNNFLYQTDEDFLSKITIFENESLSPSNVFSFNQENGNLVLKGFIKRNSLPISSLFKYKVQFSYFTISSYLYFSILFIDCNFGERLTDNFECIPCPIDNYIFETDFLETSESCKSCLTKPFNCYGGDNLVPMPGFWRYNSKSSNFIQCFIDSNCLGDNNLLNSSDYSTVITEEMKRGLCQEGYVGPLCSVCAPNYGKVDRYHCVRCDDSRYSTVLVITTLVRAGFVIASVYYATQKCNSLSSNSQKSIEKVFKSNLLKMITNHMQILIIIYSFPFQWPTEINLFLGYFFSVSPNVAEGFSMDCFTQKNGLSINSIYLKLEFIAIYPVILLIISLLVLKGIKKGKRLYKNCKKRMKKNRLDQKPKNNNLVNKRAKLSISFAMKLVCVFAIILYNCYQDIMKFVLQMFSCLEVGDPIVAKFSEKRLLIDLSIDCNAEYHKKMLFGLVLPLFLIIGFLFPLMVLLYLSKLYQKGNLNKPDNLYKFGYFYFSYKRKFFYWDFIILFRKTALLFIYCLFFSGKQGEDIYPIFIFLIILLISLFIQMETKPFEVENFDLLNVLEKYSLSSLSMTIYLSLFLFTYLSNNQSYRDQIFFATMAIMAFCNIVFFYKWIKISFKHLIKPEVQSYIEKTNTLIHNIKSKINSSFGSLAQITGTTSMETIDSERKGILSGGGERMRRISLDILKQIKQKNEDSYNLDSTNANVPPNLTRKLSKQIILEEEEEESPLRAKIKRRSMENDLLTLKRVETDKGSESIEEYISKTPQIKGNTEEIIEDDLVIECNQDENMQGNIEDINENTKAFENFLQDYDKNIDETVLIPKKKDFISSALFNDHKKIIENDDFAIEYETIINQNKPLVLKIYLKAHHGQFEDFQIRFPKMQDLSYRYNITYMSSQDSPLRNRRKTVIREKIKEFFPSKNRISIRFSIQIWSLNFLEIFNSTAIFKIVTQSNQKNYNVCLAIPVTLNKFSIYYESEWQNIGKDFQIKILNCHKEITVIEKIFPLSQKRENEDILILFGTFSLVLPFSSGKEICYELIFSKKNYELVLKMKFIDEQNEQTNEFLLKKLCGEYDTLLREWALDEN